MSKNESIFTEKVNTGYTEEDVINNYEEFRKVVTSRRSVRVFDNTPVSDEVINNALDDAILAPNSSNLQPWHFIWVKDEDKRKGLARLCFGQNGAKTAQHLIVCIGKTNTWKEHCKMTLEQYAKSNLAIPKSVRMYYEKLAPMAYGNMGPFGIFSPLKWLLLNIIGLTKVMAREPVWPSQLKTWALKSTALGCENFVLSIRAQNFDSLCMEGLDSKRVKKYLNLGRHDHIAMIIAVGKRANNGIYGPQMRFSRDRFITKI